MDEILKASSITKEYALFDKRFPGGVTIPAGTPYWIGKINIEGRGGWVYGTSSKICRERLIEMIRTDICDLEFHLNNLKHDLNLLLKVDEED